MDYIKIGKIQNTYGLDGKIIIKHDLKDENLLLKLKHVFIELQPKSYIPFFIEAIQKLNSREAWMQLEEVTSVEEAKALVGKAVLVEQKIQKNMASKIIPDDLAGFVIIDEKMGLLGKIEHIFETPGQVIATLTYKEKEVLIPLVESTILKINAGKKEINVSLPDGLIDVYLG